MNRRGFLGTLIALAAPPAIVRASSLMPLRPLWPTGLIAPPDIDSYRLFTSSGLLLCQTRLDAGYAFIGMVERCGIVAYAEFRGRDGSISARPIRLDTDYLSVGQSVHILTGDGKSR